MTFEAALEEIGGYGLFNKTLLTAIVALGTWHMTLGYFGHLFTLLAPATSWCLTNGSDVLTTADITTKGSCQFVTWRGGENLTTRTDKGATCPTGWAYDDDDVFVTAAMENNWLCGNSGKLYTVHTCHWIGSVAGFLVSGFLADRFGRKKTVTGLILTTMVANSGSAIFADFVPFAIFRFFAGFGTYTTCTSCFILVMEYTVASRRTLVGFVWGLSWTLMAVLYPWYAYLLSNWRGLLISTVVLDGILLLLFWFAPESSCWLLSVGKKDRALKVLLRIAKFNGKVVNQDHLEKTLFQDDGKEEAPGADKKRGFWSSTVALVATPRIRRNTLLLFPLWCFITMSIYVGSLQLGRLGLHVYSVYSVTSAFELPVNVFCILALDRLGRRWPNVTFMLVGGVVCVTMAVVQTESKAWTLVMAVTYMMCFSGGFNITYQIASELFPTVIRGRAVLLQRVMSDLGSVLGTQVAATVEWNQYLPLLISGILAILAAGLLLFLPETVGLPLPQSIADGENLAKDRGFCFCPCLSRKNSRDAINELPLSARNDPLPSTPQERNVCDDRCRC